MADYNESTVAGQTWQRAYQIVIENTRGSAPVIRFDEERVIALEDGTEVRKPLGNLAVSFDPTASIPLLNPLTGEPTGGTITHGEVYAILYSAYIASALARDAVPQEP